jgi:hypothetical protein
MEEEEEEEGENGREEGGVGLEGLGAVVSSG